MKITINEKQDNLLREYLDKEYGMPLKKYFDKNCHNSDFILRRYFPLFSLFLKRNGYDEDYYQAFEVKDNKDPNIDKLINYIDPLQADDFYIWLWNNRQYARHDPEASFFLTDPKLIKNKWVIHFTNKSSALDICEHGFQMGIPKEKMSQLAYTAKVNPKNKSANGYVYAYDVDKIYNGHLSLRMVENAPAAVMCQVNGIEVHHGTDMEDQIIFHPSTVKNMVLLLKTDDVNLRWQVARNTIQRDDLRRLDKHNDKLISPNDFNTLDAIIEWVKTNSFQYRNIIFWKYNGLNESKEAILDEGMLLASKDSPLMRVGLKLGYSLEMIEKLVENGRCSLYPCSPKELKWNLVKVNGNLNDENAYTRATLRLANHPCDKRNLERAISDFPQCKWMISIVIGGNFGDKQGGCINSRILKGEGYFIVEYFIPFSVAEKSIKPILEVINSIKNGNYIIGENFYNWFLYYRPAKEEDKDLMARLNPNDVNIINPLEEEYLNRSGFKVFSKTQKKEEKPKYAIRADYTFDDLFKIAKEENVDLSQDNFEIIIPSNIGKIKVFVDVYNETYTFKNYGNKKVTLPFADSINNDVVVPTRSLNMENKIIKKISIIKPHENIIRENIKIHKGENGRKYSTQGRWEREVECPHCGEKAYFSMSISDGNRGRGRIKVTDEEGKETDSEVQTIALYYCPHCHKFIARNNMA